MNERVKSYRYFKNTMDISRDHTFKKYYGCIDGHVFSVFRWLGKWFLRFNENTRVEYMIFPTKSEGICQFLTYLEKNYSRYL